MIAPSGHEGDACRSAIEAEAGGGAPEWLALVRYGRVPQVARFGGHAEAPQRGAEVVVATERGEELGVVLHVTALPPGELGEGEEFTGLVVRGATPEDLESVSGVQRELDAEFGTWLTRAATWNLQLEIIDLEKTLDGRLVLYVLNDRGPETTRLALLAAAAGHGVVHVQPVSAEGIVQQKAGGGCGDCGCSTH